MDKRAAYAVKAAQQVDEKRKEDFTFETVLSSNYKIDILKKAKDSDYFIKCIFILIINPMLNIARVEARFANGGHNVDSETIKKRYYKSLANIKKLIKLCDILHVYDNSTDKPVRIIQKHKELFSIFPNKL